MNHSPSPVSVSRVFPMNLVQIITIELETIASSEESYCNGEKDRVAVAFSKFDLDKDGFLTWEEFTGVKNVVFNRYLKKTESHL